MRYIALDIGDVWTGIAMSDPCALFAKPHTTVSTEEIEPFLETILQKEKIAAIIVGYPQTMRGTESEQTKKTVSKADALKIRFPDILFILWDERLSSRHAQGISTKSTKHMSPQQQKQEKLMGHARAAAFILSAYLDRLHWLKSQAESE